MIIIKSKNLEITSALEEFINEKSKGLERMIDEKNIGDIIIEIEKETSHHRKGEVFLASGLAEFPGKKISVQERAEDARQAIVGMIDDFKVEVEKYKSKEKELVRRRQRNSEKFVSSTDENYENGTE